MFHTPPDVGKEGLNPNHFRFPGSQPVSFVTKDLEKLETQEYVKWCNYSHVFTIVFLSYWVCEKSDGIRVLLLVATEQGSGGQSVYIVSSVRVRLSRVSISLRSDRST